jgi:hypothetical protein
LVLQSLLEPRDKDTIAGDLWEEYCERLSEGIPTRRVIIWYLRQVLSFVTWPGLRRAFLPGCLTWTALAAVIEFLLFFGIPVCTGISAEWAVFGFVAGTLGLAAATALRNARERKTVLQLTALWSLPLLAAILLVMRTAPFNPVPGVAMFLFCVPASALHASVRTARTTLGIATALTVSCFIAVLAIAAGDPLHHPHPSADSLSFVPTIAAILGAVGGLLGSNFRQSGELELTRLSL